MSEKPESRSRRNFMKAAGTAGIGAITGATLKPQAALAKTNPLTARANQVEKRIFGKSGINVSMLSLDGMFDIHNSKLLPKQAMK